MTFAAVVELLTTNFTQMTDGRSPERTRYSLRDTLLSGFAIFYFQHPSLLQFQASLKRKKGRSNLETMFGVRDVPAESQMRETLDAADPESVRAILPQLFERVRRVGWASQFQSEISRGSDAGKYYVTALDGTQYFESSAIGCQNCLHRTDKTGAVHHRHLAVAATIVRAGSHRILPLDAEIAVPQDGSEKQDCEMAAAKRLVQRVRREHPQLPMIVTADDLYSHVPFVELCAATRMKWVLVCKPTSHEETFEWAEELERMGANEWVRWSVGPACERQSYEARIVRHVPLRAADTVYTTLVEVWQKNKAGELVYHNSWVTNLEVTAENVAEVVSIGRVKWKIENEQFNVQKNGGYHLTHNFGHGQQNLSAVFYYLNVVAYVSHLILELGCQLFRRVRAEAGRRDELWHGIRTLLNYWVWESWRALLLHMLDDEVGESP
ncbi:MAG: hypothetical protein H0T92_16465 [Pyrinomonadaceae bacterium]|nr:hypothetical protein [Pyrinomonadaceae bacterium]